MPIDVAAAKRALRAELRERRRVRTSTERDAAAAGLAEQLTLLVGSCGARTVSCYLSTPNEPDTSGFLEWSLSHSVRVLLPVSRPDGLLDWATHTDTTSQTGLHGMPEPHGDRLGPIAVDDADLMLIPAAAVDRAGMRLGWGRGYFDKTIGSMRKCPPVYAVLFDDELLDEVPREVHDQPVDGVVTPTRTVAF